MPYEACAGKTIPRIVFQSRLPFWADVLRSLTRRGLRGVQMVISDARDRLKAFVVQTVPVRRGNAPLAPFLARLTVC